MYLVVGLGNPGSRYEATRHNAGFMVVDQLAGSQPWREKFQGLLALVELEGQRVALLKPQTFMNESGRSVGPCARYYQVPLSNVVVVHDELDLPLGVVRLKQGGGDAGHNGLRSLRAHLGSGDFVRLRLGIGRPQAGFRGADYVLEVFPPAEQGSAVAMLQQAETALRLLLRQGLGPAMNTVNQRK